MSRGFIGDDDDDFNGKYKYNIWLAIHDRNFYIVQCFIDIRGPWHYILLYFSQPEAVVFSKNVLVLMFREICRKTSCVQNVGTSFLLGDVFKLCRIKGGIPIGSDGPCPQSSQLGTKSQRNYTILIRRTLCFPT